MLEHEILGIFYHSVDSSILFIVILNFISYVVDCCVGLQVWNITTRGMCSVGQEEIVVLLEVAPGETRPPRHLFAFFHTVYQQANKGKFSKLG